MRGDRVWKRRSDRFTISVTQDTLRNLGKSGFSAPFSLWPHAVLRPALSQPGVESRGAKLRA